MWAGERRRGRLQGEQEVSGKKVRADAAWPFPTGRPGTPLEVRGVGRIAGFERDLSVTFNRTPTDDELRHVHDTLRSMGSILRLPRTDA